jgi:hypothetical protein
VRSTDLRNKYVLVVVLCAILAFQFAFAPGHAFARKSKNIILVLDTSMSMIGQAGGRNILGRVKKSIKEYIDQNVEDGDRVTFVTFDTDARIYPSVLVDDDNDRDILKKYISMTEATGLWTYTYKMIYKVFQAAERIEKQERGGNTEIVIMTDAIDDPPPGQTNRFNLKDFAEKFGKNPNLWVYVISYTSLQGSSAAKRLGKQLSLVTKKVKIIETSEPEKGNRTLTAAENIQESKSRSILIPLLIAIGCVLLVLAVIYVIRKLSELRVAGRLEYWNNEIIEPYIYRFDLSKRPSKEVKIGKGIECAVNIRDINIKSPFSIKAVKMNGAVRMRLFGNKGNTIETVNRESDGTLNNGDIFKVGNYTFKYFSS